MKNKICSICKKKKKINEFLWKQKKLNRKHSSCKICYKEQRKISYLKNKDSYSEKNKRLNERNIEWFLEYKKTLKCKLCPENDVAVLDFHHIDSNKKDFNVASMIGSTYSIERIKKEIMKCIVLCSNCHRKHHYYNTIIMYV